MTTLGLLSDKVLTAVPSGMGARNAARRCRSNLARSSDVPLPQDFRTRCPTGRCGRAVTKDPGERRWARRMLSLMVADTQRTMVAQEWLERELAQFPPLTDERRAALVQVLVPPAQRPQSEPQAQQQPPLDPPTGEYFLG